MFSLTQCKTVDSLGFCVLFRKFYYLFMIWRFMSDHKKRLRVFMFTWVQQHISKDVLRQFHYENYEHFAMQTVKSIMTSYTRIPKCFCLRLAARIRNIFPGFFFSLLYAWNIIITNAIVYLSLFLFLVKFLLFFLLLLMVICKIDVPAFNFWCFIRFIFCFGDPFEIPLIFPCIFILCDAQTLSMYLFLIETLHL